MVKKKGHIKWYDSIKGYGYIFVKENKQDVFFRFEEIEQLNFAVESPRKGDRVLFELDKNDKGLIARQIELKK